MRLSRVDVRTLLVSILVCGLLVGGLFPLPSRAQDPDTSEVSIPVPPSAPGVADSSDGPDVPFVVTPDETVKGMLELANVSKEDVVYDLGSGDGRIPITAAQLYDAQGVGIEIRADLVRRARKNAKLSGLSNKVEFRNKDLFQANFSDATVVTLYLFPGINIELRPLLFEQLEPGTRVVSHSFDMDEWEPDSTVRVNQDILYLWRIPKKTPDFVKTK